MGRVMALDLVKIADFQLVSPVTQKVFELQAWIFIGGMLISMCSCAPGVLLAESSSKGGFMALDLEKIGNFVRHKFVSRIFP